jgi:hypothetical protein
MENLWECFQQEVSSYRDGKLMVDKPGKKELLK